VTNQTILYPLHQEAHATFVDFAGWHMPLHYGSQIEEHLAVRKDAGMFDVSHMGVIDISGAQSKDLLLKVMANDINKLIKPGKALYTCMLNQGGGVLDDLIVYFLQPGLYRLVVNAACREKDFAWLQQQARDYNVNLVLHEKDLAIIAVQGPNAVVKFSQILANDIAEQVKALKKFTSLQYNNWQIARTGYTGEDGVEIILPYTDAVACWQNLLQQGISPIGLGARDTLRLEAGFNLYGNDMDEITTPLESNLAWTVAMEPANRDFIGRAALEAQLKTGLQRQLFAVQAADKAILRHGQIIYVADHQVGVVTSGSYSPSLQRGIGFMRVALPQNKDYFVDIRGVKHRLLMRNK